MNASKSVQDVQFKPRRIGHGNFFVSDLERSMAYYEHVFGLQVVFREPGIGAGFLSNGNSHHDVGLIEIPKKTLIGRDGQVQVPVKEERKPGLNHIGLEMESEAHLVAAYERAMAAGAPVHRTVDHTIAYSVYMFDPDGYYLEFYADSQDDWRAIMEEKSEQLLTGDWTPDPAVASDVPKYVVETERRTVEGAPLQPHRAARASLFVRDLATSIDFYADIVGLTLVAGSAADGYAVFAGTVGSWDLGLFQVGEDATTPRMHHFGFELSSPIELETVMERLRAAGARVEGQIVHATKQSVCVRDPDGILFEFYFQQSRDAAALQNPPKDPAFLV
ncbi:VOC family protein [Actinomadura chokoriensis]|uniref:VOC family protein n=1 Tax=Actinomadura chokoriensis TaxID=454156 RepID=UPI0031F9077C